ncbi:sugar kinase [Algirhabdus cladophorae]|uniref:sugar kinase n=1 Tax=Algirhabdus cladophorae TaxID=3377108 RepID=UPI003B84A917
MKIACIGEAMVEVALSRAGDTARIGFAGDTLNTAIYLARKQPDWHVAYLSRVGADDLSSNLLAYMADQGVQTDLVGISQTRSVGLYSIATDDTGERSFSYWRDTSAARETFGAPTPDFADLSGFSVVYLSAITLAILPKSVRDALLEALQAYRRTGGRVAFDSNFRPKLWEDHSTAQTYIEAFWRITDIALPSVDDEMAVFGDVDRGAVSARLKGFGITQGALKCGPTGPLDLSPAQIEQDYPAAQKVIDTTAAGDSFNAGFLAAYLAGKGAAASLMAGHELAADVIGYPGAIMPKDA